MHLSVIILSLLFLFGFVTARKLPSYFTKCKYPTGFKECVLMNIENSLQFIVENGDKDFKINRLNPLIIKQLTLQANPTLVVELSEVSFGDYESMMVKDIKIDFTKNKVSMHYGLGNFSIVGKYMMDGHLLMLPISGTGDLTFECRTCQGYYDAKLSRYSEGGSDYFKISDDQNVIEPSYCFYYVTNLFGGNKQLGDQMIILVNENWMVLYQEAKPALSSAFSTIMTTIINKYFSQIPIDELVEFEDPSMIVNKS